MQAAALEHARLHCWSPSASERGEVRRVKASVGRSINDPQGAVRALSSADAHACTRGSTLLVTLCGRGGGVCGRGEAREHTCHTCAGRGMQASGRIGAVPSPAYLPATFLAITNLNQRPHTHLVLQHGAVPHFADPRRHTSPHAHRCTLHRTQQASDHWLRTMGASP